MGLQGGGVDAAFGTCTTQATGTADVDAAHLLDHADRRMYEDKRRRTTR
jgi:hypothetical protein